MSVAAKIALDLDAIAAEVAAGLASAELWQGRAYIRTPVLLPSGSSVVVVIETNGGRGFHLTDMGQGLEEAVELDIARSYRLQAETLAERNGLDCKAGVFTVSGVGRDQLQSAVTVIANAVATCLDRARLSAADRTKSAAIQRLADRLARLYNPSRVHKSAEIKGASTHQWRIDALVETDHGQAVFELVTPHPNSVAATTTKFHDLARLDHPPARIAVVQSKKAMGDLLAVTAQAARVIEEGNNDDTWRRAALAA